MNRSHFLCLRLVLCLSGFAFVSPVWGQQNCLDTYDREAIYLRTEFFRGTVYVKNGVSKPLGFSYKRLVPEFEQTPFAMPILKKARRNFKAQFWISMAGVVGTTAGAMLALQSFDHQGNVTNERQFRNGLNLMCGSAIISTAIGLPLQIKSRQQLDDAVYLRNREILGR
jgi:hypothetical protein